jgi:outer membrane protein TolC
MATPANDPTDARLAELERQVTDLRRRLAAIEARLLQSTGARPLQPREEHPLDRDTVKEKVVFDWQT